MVITLGNIVFGGKGNGGGTPAAYVVPDGMSFAKSELTEFPSDVFDFSQKKNYYECWEDCSKLTSFPQLDLHNGTNFHSAWYNCASLTSFPQLDLSNGNSFYMTWTFCSSLKEFPALDLHNGNSFGTAWGYCTSLTTFPALDLHNGTYFGGAWQNCSSLTNLGGFGAISADIDLSASTLLTVESLMNVINQAATVTGKTMKFGSDNLAKLTDEQKAVATSKGWTLA